jgi:hypothetical protein
MFLFAVGYGVGPQFFRGLKGDGIQQVLFAVIQCVAVLLTAVVVGKFLGYDAGGTAGLLAGSSTISAVLGVASNSMPAGIGDAESVLNAMPVAYAVTISSAPQAPPGSWQASGRDPAVNSPRCPSTRKWADAGFQPGSPVRLHSSC